MVAAAAATADSAAAAATAADSTVIASTNAVRLATSDMSACVFTAVPVIFGAGEGDAPASSTSTLMRSGLPCMQIMHVPFPEGLPSWTKVHSQHSQGIVPEQYEGMVMCHLVCCVECAWGVRQNEHCKGTKVWGFHTSLESSCS